MVNVLIVEDQVMAQENMGWIVKSCEGFNLLAKIPNAADAELVCMRERVDLIIMDVCTAHDESGIEATAVVKKSFPQTKVMIVTSLAECSFIDRAKKAGADSFCYKDATNEELAEVIKRTAKGEKVFPQRTPEVKLGLITSYDLTQTELDVIRALMESTSDENAAEMLNCTKANVRWHLARILDKTGYRTRMELLVAVAQKGLILVTPDKMLGF